MLLINEKGVIQLRNKITSSDWSYFASLLRQGYVRPRGYEGLVQLHSRATSSDRRIRPTPPRLRRTGGVERNVKSVRSWWSILRTPRDKFVKSVYFVQIGDGFYSPTFLKFNHYL